MFLTVSLVLVALGTLYVYLVWHFNYWKDRNVPGPKPMPLLGSFPSFVLRHRPFLEEMDETYRKYKGTYNFVGVFGNRSPRIFVLSSALAKNILSKDFKHFHDNEFSETINKEADPLFGRNPFMLNGEEWKQKRAEITPAFTTSRMKALYSFVEDVGSRMTDYLKQQASKPVEAKELAAKFTTDVVSSCIFAADAQSFTSDKPEIQEMGRKLLDFSFFSFVCMIFMEMFPKIAKKLKIGFISKSIEKFFCNLMSEAITHREASVVKRIDYLDYLINLRKKKEIAEIDMAAHGVTFFIDGFETSSVAISFALYELARNPAIQKRLREELQRAPVDNGLISYDILQELPYLDQVLSEVLRLWPPAAFLSKRCTEAIELEVTSTQKVLVEKGVCAYIPLWSIHRDPDNFDDPLAFNPDRFSTATGGTNPYREKGCFFPFGDGPRQCLGMRFARMQVKRGIYEIIMNFEVTMDSKTKDPLLIDPKQLLTGALGGIWLNFNPIWK
ncbi:probable cytochrome P450 28a5 [Sabethes cyaneus]|uniref:probable cytochrome P450 28a5 n=1 Tax=Sabethes cyaneus TaxID=53552 RepID=UPI00237D889A|nr:probable cytochrome P450 28a5 [Sabethes cyaneus]